MTTPWGRQGIRWRLAMLYLSIFAACLSVFCAILFQYFQRTQIQAFDTTLFNFTVDIANNLEMDFVGRLFVVNSGVAESGKFFPFHLGSTFVEIRDEDGNVILHSRSLQDKNLPLSWPILKEVRSQKFAFRTIHTSDLGLKATSPDLRLITYWADRADWQTPLVLQVAVPLDLPREERRDLLLFFLIGIPGCLLVVGLAGVWMSKQALKPVHDMTVKARGITGVGKLKERIPVPVPQDEIRELAETFNRLLERLDQAFDSQDRFISNASHQLKTPLTILKGELDLLRKSQPEAGEVRTGLDSAAGEINRLITLVQDLLLLARLEAGQDTISMTPVRMDEVLLRVVSRLQKLAAGKQVQIVTHFLSENPGAELEAEAEGDEELLDSMIENFIENAIKYSPEGRSVELTMKTYPTWLEINIRDHGPGIPEDLRQKIFERFTRGQPSNIVPGSGLGLSIAAEIARLHNIQIDVSEGSDHTGTRITLKVPGSFCRSGAQ